MIPNFKKEFIRFTPNTKGYYKFHEELYALQKGKCLCCGRDGYIFWSPVHHGEALYPHHEPPRSSQEWEDMVEKCLLLCHECHIEKVHGGKVKIEFVIGWDMPKIGDGHWLDGKKAVWKFYPVTPTTSKATRIKELREKEEQ